MNVSGHYIRTGQGDSAELHVTLTRVVPNKYSIEGLALWGEGRPGGPNIGVLEFSGILVGNTILHSEDTERNHRITLTFSEGELKVHEENFIGIYGMNVSFEGTYKRAGRFSGLFSTLRMAARRLLTD